MPTTITPSFDEMTVLDSCAQRFNGYHWADKHALDFGALMNGYWDPATFDDLFTKPADYQLAVWCLQARSLRHDWDPPGEDLVSLWRRLFLAFGHVEPPRLRVKGEAHLRNAWRRDFQPWVEKLQHEVCRRLELSSSVNVPIIIEDQP